jgi:predicted O-linked N-acetylglucosamine transferase (SPINDLY family)
MPSIPEALRTAWEHHAAGRTELAERIYRQILAVDPDNWDALRLLGILVGQNGRFAQAVEYLSAAVHIDGKQPEVHWNLGSGYLGLGKHQDAIGCYQQALRLRPDYAEAHYGLGRAQQMLGRVDEAASSYHQALRCKSDYVDALSNLGSIWSEKGLPEEAANCYRRALEIRPDYAPAAYNLGNVQLDQGQLADAAASYERALAIRPDYVAALANLGLVLKNLGRLEEAAACLRRALSRNPNSAPAHNTLGLVLHKQGQLDAAAASLRQSISLEPGFAVAHNNLGHVLDSLGQLDDAVASFRRAVELKPDYVEADSNLLNTLQFCPGYDSYALAEEGRRWDQQHARPLARFIRPHANDLSPDRRLRVGYISPDFRDHVVGRNILPLLRCHDPTRVEVTLYASVKRTDAMSEQLRQHAHHWHTIADWPDDKVVDKIVADRIDILVDLALHLSGNRLLVLGRKPAPVQVTFAGYPGSTGLRTIDYRLTDPYLDPPGMFDAFYSEASYRLPHSFWCYDPQATEPSVNSLPANKNGHVTFGCLNNFCKINVPTLKVWARVLRAVHGSRLLLLTHEGSHCQRTRDRLAQEGIAPNRITFAANRPRHQYLELYHQIDVGLDTSPYNGHTTSLDSFWMGIPVVTLVGPTVVGRAGLCQLTNLGLTDLIATTPEEFVDAAAGLASDLVRLSDLRASLRTRMQKSPLMDAAGFARGIEAAYRDMWRRWCESKK